MTHRLTTNCAKNYCNRTLIVKVIVAMFFLDTVYLFTRGLKMSVFRNYRYHLRRHWWRSCSDWQC